MGYQDQSPCAGRTEVFRLDWRCCLGVFGNVSAAVDYQGRVQRHWSNNRASEVFLGANSRPAEEHLQPPCQLRAGSSDVAATIRYCRAGDNITSSVISMDAWKDPCPHC